MQPYTPLSNGQTEQTNNASITLRQGNEATAVKATLINQMELHQLTYM